MGLSDYDKLAELAERGGLLPVPGTILRGEAAVAAAQAVVLAATGADSIEEASRIALDTPPRAPAPLFLRPDVPGGAS